MHITLPMPHPFARLARVIAALEQARGVTDPGVSADENLLDRLAATRAAEVRDDRCDLEFLSLTRCEERQARPRDELDFVSLSLVEEPDPDLRDSLGDLSLERGFPPRPRG